MKAAAYNQRNRVTNLKRRVIDHHIGVHLAFQKSLAQQSDLHLTLVETTRAQERQLHAVEMRMLRWACGCTRQDGVRKEDVRAVMKTAPIQLKMKEQRLRNLKWLVKAPIVMAKITELEAQLRDIGIVTIKGRKYGPGGQWKDKCSLAQVEEVYRSPLQPLMVRTLTGKLCRTVVRPSLLYTTKRCVLGKAQKRQLHATEMRVPRWACGWTVRTGCAIGMSGQ
ncbi:unnamed protein product [Heligmosomoides polygyrus]|uniref:Endonuclease-reverse transcriptase n=1 Tax=Heligmosomoides polygyrus TaxID=6339 RepID=A0A183FGE8_HELPZ|nr:unnamed protein product [Heligmosomoides polygyrus]